MEYLQVAQGCRVEEKGAGAAILLKRAQVFRASAEIVSGVLDQGAGRAQGGVIEGEAKALQIEHAQGFHDGFGAGIGLKLKGRELRAEPGGAKLLEGVEGGLLVGGGLPAGEFILCHEDFSRIERGEDGEEVLGTRIGSDTEFACGEIEPGGVQTLTIEKEGGEVVVTLGLDLVGGEGRPRREDTRELAFDQFTRFGGFGLVADGHLFTESEQFAHVGIGGVERDAGHRVFHAAGESQAEQFGRHDGILEKELVEIAQTEEQEGVARQAAFHLKVLLHHRTEFLGLVGHVFGSEAASEEPRFSRGKPVGKGLQGDRRETVFEHD